MSTLLSLALTNAVCAALLAVPAVLAGRFGKRPALAHALWLLVLVKLVTPPLFQPRLPWLPDDAPAAVTPPPAPAGSAYAFVAEEPPPVFVGEAGFDGAAPEPPQTRAATFAPAVPPPPDPAPAPSTAVDAPAASTDWTSYLGVLWAAGAVVWFGRAAWLVYRFGRLLRHGRRATEELQAEAHALAARLGLTRAPAVWLLPGPVPPLVWAVVGRARLFFPAGLLERLGPDERAALLLHELAHVRRRDHWVRWLELVVSGLYWWYPLTWWARRRIRCHEEECCDARVTAELPARAYASAILETLDFLAGAPPVPPPLASGLGRAGDLKRRLTMILSGPVSGRLPLAARLALLALAALLLPLLPVLARAEKKADEPGNSGETAKPRPADPVAAPATEDEPTAFNPTPLNLFGGNNEVFSLAVSPDGKLLASGAGYWDRPGEVKLWDLASRKEVRSFRIGVGSASVAFSPDGRMLASAGYDARAHAWDVSTGRELFVLALDGPARVAFSPDGKLLATASEAKTVKLWDAASGKEIANLQGDLERFHCVAFSRDGKLLAAGGGDWNEGGTSHVAVWDVGKTKQVAKLAHPRPVLAVSFSPDNRTLATGGLDGALRRWDLGSFKIMAEYKGHEGWVEGLAFSPDGKTLASGSHDSTVQLWDVDKNGLFAKMEGHTGPVRAAAFTPDGKTLITGGGDLTIKLWEPTTGKEIATLLHAEAGAPRGTGYRALAYSPDGKTLALATDDTNVELRDAAGGDLRRTLKGHADAVTCLAFSRDGKILATGSPDKTVILWDVGTGEDLRTLHGHTSWVYALAFSADGKLLASAGYDKSVRLWDPATGKEIASATGHKSSVRALAFSPDGKTLASGGGDRTVKLWNLGDLTEIKTLTGHEGAVRGLAFSPDGKTLATASEDGTARLWTVSGKEIASLKGHTGEVFCIAFSPGGKTLVTGGADATVRVWDAVSGVSLAVLNGHGDAVTGLAFSPDGTRLATTGADRTVKLWRIMKPQPPPEPKPGPTEKKDPNQVGF